MAFTMGKKCRLCSLPVDNRTKVLTCQDCREKQRQIRLGWFPTFNAESPDAERIQGMLAMRQVETKVVGKAIYIRKGLDSHAVSIVMGLG